MGKKPIARLAWSAAVLALLAPAAVSAVQPDAALGSSGELYVVKAGTYGVLFPGRRQTDAANRILSLEIGRPGQLPSRQPVPSTEGTDVEVSPSVTYEEASHRLYVLWESRSSATYSVLKLISFDGTRWSDAIEVSGNPASAKGAPRLAITHDTIQMAAAGGARVDRHRSTLHLVWAEGDGRTAKSYYTPIILVDGEYLGWNPVYSLGDLDSPDVAPLAADPASSLLQSPTVAAGRDGRTVVVSFVSATTRRQTSIQVNLLPGELQQIADGTRAVIIDAGNRLGLSLPAGRPQLADKARAALIESGVAFEEDVVRSLVERVQGEILGSDLTDLT
ncbi:MAG TPA: hypothetical protein VMW27_01965, partial [Thermoanaerobaculia bacterium]|nr:hypothetical protein [Thermoanaerobaculia bacterium]